MRCYRSSFPYILIRFFYDDDYYYGRTSRFVVRRITIKLFDHMEIWRTQRSTCVVLREKRGRGWTKLDSKCSFSVSLRTIVQIVALLHGNAVPLNNCLYVPHETEKKRSKHKPLYCCWYAFLIFSVLSLILLSLTTTSRKKRRLCCPRFLLCHDSATEPCQWWKYSGRCSTMALGDYIISLLPFLWRNYTYLWLW